MNFNFQEWDCPECGRELKGTNPGRRCRFCRRDENLEKE